jgi:MscS family membrane protein
VIRLCTLVVCLSVYATADPLNRENPQSSVTAFLQACHNKDYRRASRYLDLRRLPVNARLDQGVQLAEQLGRALDADTRFDEAALSTQPAGTQREPVATFTSGGKTQQIEMERIQLRSGVAMWLFSADSVAAIPQIASATSSSTVEKHLPSAMMGPKLFGTPAWQWAALMVAVAVAWAFARIACMLIVLIGFPALRRVAPGVRRRDLADVLAPARLMVGALLFRAAVAWIGPSAVVRKYLDHTVSLLFFGGVAWLCMEALDAGMARLSRSLHERHHTFAYSVMPLAARVSKVLIGVLAGITILSSWGYNTTAILAGLGVGGVAVALAAQKTIENLFGGVAVITDRPVVVGDFCKFGDRAGTVEDIGLRSTRLRTPERTLITVPNGNFSSMTLENFSRRDKTWFHLMLNLRRDTTAEQVRELLRTITEILQQTPKIETGSHPVRFTGVGTYSLDLEIGVYFNTIDDDELAPIQEELYLKILDAVQAAGTALALPTQAYYSFSSEGPRNGNGAAGPHEEVPARRR